MAHKLGHAAPLSLTRALYTSLHKLQDFLSNVEIPHPLRQFLSDVHVLLILCLCIILNSAIFSLEPPSPVTNVRIESVSVTLAWDPPVNFGGRNDTVYVLFYQEEGSSRHVEAVIVNTTMGTISGIIVVISISCMYTSVSR